MTLWCVQWRFASESAESKLVLNIVNPAVLIPHGKLCFIPIKIPQMQTQSHAERTISHESYGQGSFVDFFHVFLRNQRPSLTFTKAVQQLLN